MITLKIQIKALSADHSKRAIAFIQKLQNLYIKPNHLVLERVTKPQQKRIKNYFVFNEIKKDFVASASTFPSIGLKTYRFRAPLALGEQRFDHPVFQGHSPFLRQGFHPRRKHSSLRKHKKKVSKVTNAFTAHSFKHRLKALSQSGLVNYGLARELKDVLIFINNLSRVDSTNLSKGSPQAKNIIVGTFLPFSGQELGSLLAFRTRKSASIQGIRQRISRFTVLRSPFKYKKSREQFERKYIKNQLILCFRSSVSAYHYINALKKLELPGVELLVALDC